MTLDYQLPCIRINAPELRSHKAFIQWLHLRSLGQSLESDAALGFETSGETYVSRVATWHSPKNLTKPCPPGEFSDIFTFIERGEGSDSDMPASVWKKILKIVGPEFHGVVWLTFLEHP